MHEFVDVSKAKELLKGLAISPKSHIIPLSQAVGKFTSSPIFAPMNVPSFDNSGMDGYAFAWEDLGESRKLAQIVQAGAHPDFTLEKGTAVRIFTGAPVPDGADTVVQQEWVTVVGDTVFFELEKLVKGMHVRKAGSQCQEGEIILNSGTQVTPGTIGLLASLGIEQVEVFRSPNVSIILTGDEIIEMDRMRKLIAEHMVMSKHVSPHVTSYVEADVTNIVEWRNKVKGEFSKREGENITFTPIFIEAIAKAIKDFPMINVSVSGTTIVKRKDINIGMATALPSGNLIVPVIKNADRLNLVGITKAVNDLANKARNNKLKPEDIQGGTFTITNVGSFGNVMGTPIINQPQVAILAVGAIRKMPAVVETPHGDFIGIRHKMFLSHAYDHRVVDGSLGGMFVRRVADYLEQFDVNREI